MAVKVTMLDRVLILAQHERKALKDGNVDLAVEFFEERSALLAVAREKHDEENDREYLFKLAAIQGYDEMNYAIGDKLRTSIKESLQGTKKSNKVAKSYMQVAKQY